MRYIRTKNGIYKIRSLLGYTGYEVEKKQNEWHTDLLEVEENDIIKHADTIEELCDEIVVRYFNGTEFYAENGVVKIEIIHTRHELLHWRGTGLYIGHYKAIFYGAIWCDKGLIYVAEMKGILPNGEIDWELL